MCDLNTEYQHTVVTSHRCDALVAMITGCSFY